MEYPNDSNKVDSNPLSPLVLMQRLTVIALYFLAWAAIAFLLGPFLRTAIGLGPYDTVVPESLLRPSDSLTRFVSCYWYVAMLFMGIPFAIISWVVLVIDHGRFAVRWKWLIANAVAMAPMLVLTWLLLRNMLFLP